MRLYIITIQTASLHVRIQHCETMEAPRLALASPEGTSWHWLWPRCPDFRLSCPRVRQIARHLARRIVRRGMRRNESTKRLVYHRPRVRIVLPGTMGAKVVTYWHERSAWAFRQVWGWIIENREQFREIVLKKCRFNEQIAKLFLTVCTIDLFHPTF